MAGIPTRTDVVVIGAGLSGLTTVHELAKHGITDVVLLEAQPEAGGRLKTFHRPDGGHLVRGGEFIGETYTSLLTLADELGLEYETLPAYQDGEPERLMIRRTTAGVDVREPYPFADSPASAEQLHAVIAELDALAATIDPVDPWRSPNARELDNTSFGDWLASVTEDVEVRSFLASDLVYLGDHDDVSLLQMAHFIACFGDYEGHDVLVGRLAGGTSLLTDRLLDRYGDRVVTSAAVDTIEQTADGVTVTSRAGVVTADRVILAVQPSIAAAIEFVPPLPHARDRLQDRWIGGHGVKVVAIYDSPFWLDQGLNGLALGQPPFQQVLDDSPVDRSEGVLVGFHIAGNASTATFSDLLSKEDAVKDFFCSHLVGIFGEDAATPKEMYVFDFAGSRWSAGCAPQLPLGVLSTLGPALRPPVGRIHWGGADTEDVGWLEGAVRAGVRTASEVAALR